MGKIVDSFMVGKKVFLRPLRKEDAEGNWVHWLNDPDACRYNRHGRFPNTQEQSLEYLEGDEKSSTMIALAIVEKKNNRHIGNVSLSNITWIDRDAELSIIIEKDSWGKGYGKEACGLMIRHAFTTLNLHRVFSGTHEENLGFQKIATSLGMIEEGRSKENVFKNGKYSDTIWYSVLNKKR